MLSIINITTFYHLNSNSLEMSELPRNQNLSKKIEKILKRVWDFFLKPNVLITMVVLFLITIVIIAITVPLSFGFIDYDKVAFKKNSVTNQVDKSKIYRNGVYYWGGAHFEALEFPATYQRTSFIEDERLIIFSGDIDIFIEIEFLWRIQIENLAKIFEAFGTEVGNQVKEVSKAAIMNKAPNFNILQFVKERENITAKLRNAVAEDLEKIYIDLEPHKFHLLKIRFKDELKNTFLNSAIQKIDNKKAEIQQKLNVIIAETEVLAKVYDANITLTRNVARANADNIVENANSQSFRIVEETKGVGIRKVFDVLNITEEMQKKTFFQMFEIIDSKKPELIIGDISVIKGLSVK